VSVDSGFEKLLEEAAGWKARQEKGNMRDWGFPWGKRIEERL